ncbi:UPF0481 protein At3g47200-like [Cucumis sativus]|uniref:UPF0481 protein At3g47200-like n=1 Tax=Cucumis sativus TaxID=3659 RepID=UPI0002B459A6|nr:UPF0481 protein At3g47200-like [Cucumis sativus]XP_031736551.1 UPF0481 protein At3g47200-like [Cucumis sativus]XP_031736552.1 UPF0481 protein At3g47200-like [Cucumis sativus]
MGMFGVQMEDSGQHKVHGVSNQKSNNVVEISGVDQQQLICDNVVISIEKMLDQVPSAQEKQCSIYRVPKQLCEMNPKAYAPQLISIGPFYYHAHKNLIANEQYKLQGFNNFLHRVNKMSLEQQERTRSLNDLVKKAQSWVKEARNCYAESINMNDEDFIKMMLVDGCFIVEFFILDYEEYKEPHESLFPQIENNVSMSFYKERIPDIDDDLIKLENQLPFFVLQHLFDLIPKHNDNPNCFKQLTYKYLNMGWLENYEPSDILSIKPKHFIDFLSFYFVPHHRCEHDQESSDMKEWNVIIPPSITELCEAGVTIKKAENTKCLMNIRFENGILEIPPLHIDDYFEPMMRNLLAFEHFPVEVNNTYVIPYVTFMDYLISTEKDVNLLVKEKIIINDIGGSDREVSQLFNNLCKFVSSSPNDNYFNNISEGLREHCDRWWNKAKASLKHNYFNTPWAAISFSAATVLLVLTILQTVFSAISAFPKSKPDIP